MKEWLGGWVCRWVGHRWGFPMPQAPRLHICRRCGAPGYWVNQ